MTTMTSNAKLSSSASFKPLYKPTVSHRVRVMVRALLGRENGI